MRHILSRRLARIAEEAIDKFVVSLYGDAVLPEEMERGIGTVTVAGRVYKFMVKAALEVKP